MTYKRTGRSGLKLPLISLGLWYNFGGLDVFENSRACESRLSITPDRKPCSPPSTSTGARIDL